MGIAGETYADLMVTQRFRRQLCRRFKNIGRVWTTPISMEPAAPWHLEPERFGIVCTRRTFEDFVRAGSPSGSGLGYFIPGFHADQQDSDPGAFERLLKSEKCRHHCGLHPNPAKYARPSMGRLHCFFMKQRTCKGLKRSHLSAENGRNE